MFTFAKFSELKFDFFTWLFSLEKGATGKPRQISLALCALRTYVLPSPHHFIILRGYKARFPGEGREIAKW